MKIGILGSGNVAQALGSGFLGCKDEVMLGTRDPKKLAAWQSAAGSGASVGSFRDAAAFGELLVLAVQGNAALDVLAAAGLERFAGKTLIDVTNPLAEEGGALRLSLGFDDSLGEQIQREIPDARVVKTFNTVGAVHMVNPSFPGGPPDMFLAGNDEVAKAKVSQIVRDFGWNPIDMGGIEASRLLEPLAMTWIAYGLKFGTWNHAWKLLGKD